MRLILRFFGILFSAAAVLFVVGAAVGGYFYWKYSQDLPDHAALSNYEPPVMTRVHAADGSLLAEYARERIQFDRPIGSFQAVAQRLADGYIDVKGVRLTLWQAAFRLAEGLPIEGEIETAKFWASDAGHRVAHTVVHVHGGVGLDEDHPVHRYFLAAKRQEFLLGSASDQLRRLGAELAATPA